MAICSIGIIKLVLALGRIDALGRIGTGRPGPQGGPALAEQEVTLRGKVAMVVKDFLMGILR